MTFSAPYVWNICHSKKKSATYNTITNLQWPLCKEPVIFSRHFLRRSIKSKFNKNHLSGCLVLPRRHTDRRTEKETDITKLITACRNPANASAKEWHFYTFSPPILRVQGDLVLNLRTTTTPIKFLMIILLHRRENDNLLL